jgi:hypothetical protein
MKKLPLALAAILSAFALLPISALDFGMTLSNDSTYTHQHDNSLQQIDEALAWFSSPIGSNSDLYVSGLYEYKATHETGFSDVKPWRFDAGRVELSGTSPALFGPASTLRYSLGRVETGDFSSQVLCGLSDGARLEADVGNVSLFVTGGYRGLLDKDDAYSFLSAKDAEINADDDDYFAPMRAFAGIGAQWTEFAKEHDAGIEAFGQFDLNKDVSASDKVNTQYFEPYVRGRLSHLLDWEAWGVFGLMETDSDLDKSAACGERLVFSLPEKSGLELTESISWASGDKGSLSTFVPIRRAPIDTTSYFAFTDILEAKLDASVSPMDRLALDLGAAAYFRNADADPEGDMPLRSDAAYYRGFEVSASASGKVSSDLSLNASSGLLFPNTASAYESGTKPRFTAELYAAFDL